MTLFVIEMNMRTVKRASKWILVGFFELIFLHNLPSNCYKKSLRISGKNYTINSKQWLLPVTMKSNKSEREKRKNSLVTDSVSLNGEMIKVFPCKRFFSFSFLNHDDLTSLSPLINQFLRYYLMFLLLLLLWKKANSFIIE